jgi:hypothetical protein
MSNKHQAETPDQQGRREELAEWIGYLLARYWIVQEYRGTAAELKNAQKNSARPSVIETSGSPTHPR